MEQAAYIPFSNHVHPISGASDNRFKVKKPRWKVGDTEDHWKAKVLRYLGHLSQNTETNNNQHTYEMMCDCGELFTQNQEQLRGRKYIACDCCARKMLAEDRKARRLGRPKKPAKIKFDVGTYWKPRRYDPVRDYKENWKWL